MSRYIDADEFYVSQTARCWGEPLIGTCTNDNVKLYDEIQKFPAADVVKVVRCKECKYWDAVKSPKHKGVGICAPPRKHLGGYCFRRGATNGEDFCSQGERGSRENEFR